MAPTFCDTLICNRRDGLSAKASSLYSRGVADAARKSRPGLGLGVHGVLGDLMPLNMGLIR